MGEANMRDSPTSQRERMVVFFAVWLTCWFGGWIAGGLLFPRFDTPAAIGATIGFFGGLLLAGRISGAKV
jgi:hypothetical protein